MKLDELDIKILRLLQKDAKLTNKALSAKLALSVTAIYERIKKLEKTGFIEGYVALISKEKVGKSFVAFCHVKLSFQCSEGAKGKPPFRWKRRLTGGSGGYRVGRAAWLS